MVQRSQKTLRFVESSLTELDCTGIRAGKQVRPGHSASPFSGDVADAEGEDASHVLPADDVLGSFLLKVRGVLLDEPGEGEGLCFAEEFADRAGGDCALIAGAEHLRLKFGGAHHAEADVAPGLRFCSLRPSGAEWM